MSQIMIPKNCTACGKELDPSGKFCKECGSSIESMTGMLSLPVELFCPNCGQRHGVNDKFCRFCALDLAKAREEVQTPATAELSSTTLFQTQNIPTQIQPILVTKQPVKQVASNNSASFISPSGAALVVICFFLPWLEWSACGISKTATGAELSQFDGSFLLYPLAGIISIAAYFICKSQKKIWKARPFIIISSVLGLLLLFYKVSSIPSSPDIFGQRITAADLGFKPQIGAIGTIIGFILAIIGCAFMGRIVILQNSSNPINSPNVKFGNNSLKPNAAAMLCYLAIFLLPIPIYICAYYLANLLGVSSRELAIIVTILSIFSAFIMQIFLLNKEPYNNESFIKFHAFQSIFLTIAYYALSFLILGIILVPLNGNPFSEVVRFLNLFQVGIGIVNILIIIFMAIRSYQGKIYKLPYIGDLAMSRVERSGHIIESNLSSTSIIERSAISIQINESLPIENLKTENKSTIDLLEENKKNEKEINPNSFLFETENSNYALNKIDKTVIGIVVAVAIVIIGAIAYSVSQTNNKTAQINITNTYANGANSVGNAARVAMEAANKAANAVISSSSGNTNSSILGRYGRLSTNLNLRSAANKTALSVGIHFQNARFKVLAEESYDTEEGYSTWYKVQIIEYGCDTKGTLGCGKNNSSDADEGWINTKYVYLE